MFTHIKSCEIALCDTITDKKYDAVVVLLASVPTAWESYLDPIKTIVEKHQKIVKKFSKGTHILHCEELPAARLILSFTGSLSQDVDDIRRITEAAADGITQATKAGATKPLLVLSKLHEAERIKKTWTQPKNLCLASLLGAMQALYMTLEAREFTEKYPKDADKRSPQKANLLGWLVDPAYKVDHKHLMNVAWCVEEGRRIARDIGGSDPERMSASNILAYLKEELPEKGEVVMWTAKPVLQSEYPLAAAVDRGSSEKHKGRILHLEYADAKAACSCDSDVFDLFVVGKGITYDSGGYDIKISGSMAGMHRDKCGAAATIGFFKILSLLKPSGIRVHGCCALVRNSIGENSYVSDEVITSRAGVRVRVTNTDAEGRLVMADLVAECKERALELTNSNIVTMATLTGHAILTYGDSYTAIMCNGPAREANMDSILQEEACAIGDMLEISTIRREDYESFESREENSDIRNTSRPMAGRRVRGHQSPAAFLITAAGLDKHQVFSDKPLKYYHLDIASSHGLYPNPVTATPILTLTAHYVLPRI